MKWRRDHQWEHDVRAHAKQRGVPEPPEGFKCWTAGKLAAIVSRDNYGNADLRWHISLQNRDRIPNWSELVTAAHDLRPGVPFIVGIPPRSWWMNVHPRVLHLVETRDQPLIAEWRRNKTGQEPT